MSAAKKLAEHQFALPRAAAIPSQTMRRMIEAGEIYAAQGLTEKQLQPSSLDLRLGSKAYRVQSSFLTKNGETVAQKLGKRTMYPVDLSQSAIMEKGAVYIVPLQEGLKLPNNVYAKASPKSSIGRIDVFTRLLTDGGEQFDKVAPGYNGPLYLEISPLTFTIVVHPGDTLNQLRFFDMDAASKSVDVSNRLLNCKKDLWVSVDLSGEGITDGIIGYRARRHAPVVDLSKIGTHNAADFWEPIYANTDKDLILNPEDFYILMSKESVAIEPEWAAEMMPYDVSVGELRVHYAGFFDPGFGWAEDGSNKNASRAVLEVRAHDVPALLEHGQPICSLIFEPISEPCEKIYSSGIGSNYSGQGLKLSKYFTSK